VDVARRAKGERQRRRFSGSSSRRPVTGISPNLRPGDKGQPKIGFTTVYRTHEAFHPVGSGCSEEVRRRRDPYEPVSRGEHSAADAGTGESGVATYHYNYGSAGAGHDFTLAGVSTARSRSVLQRRQRRQHRGDEVVLRAARHERPTTTPSYAFFTRDYVSNTTCSTLSAADAARRVRVANLHYNYGSGWSRGTTSLWPAFQTARSDPVLQRPTTSQHEVTKSFSVRLDMIARPRV